MLAIHMGIVIVLTRNMCLCVLGLRVIDTFYLVDFPDSILFSVCFFKFQGFSRECRWIAGMYKGNSLHL